MWKVDCKLKGRAWACYRRLARCELCKRERETRGASIASLPPETVAPRCELCKRERETRWASIASLPPETVAHIQSAGCNLQKKSVIGAHNRCWKYLIGAISTHGEANRSLEILGGDKDRQLHTLWKETNIGKILPWDDIEEEAEELIAKRREEKQASSSDSWLRNLPTSPPRTLFCGCHRGTVGLKSSLKDCTA